MFHSILNVYTFVYLCVRLKPEIDSRNAGIEGENGVIGSGAQDPDPVLDAKDGRRLVLVVLDKKVVEAARLVLGVFHVLYRIQKHVLNQVVVRKTGSVKSKSRTTLNLQILDPDMLPQSRQSAKFFLQSSELGLPQPLTHWQVFPIPPPPLWFQGEGHTRWRERGVGESLFRRGDIHCVTVVLCICMYFVYVTKESLWTPVSKKSVHCIAAII